MMQATIASWVLRDPIKSKKEFIEEICIKGFPQLLEYIDLHESLRSSGFNIHPAMYSKYIFSKQTAMKMIKDGTLALYEDFIYKDDIEIFSSKGFRKILTKLTLEKLQHIDFLEEEYRMYVIDMYDLRVDC